MSAESPQPYAVMLNVAGRLAAIIGSDARAVRAAKTLSDHGADVVVISPDIPSELLAMESEGLLTVESRAYVRGDLHDAFVAVAASGSAEIDAAVAAEARECGVLLNVPGDAGVSDFIIPSVVRRGALQIAVTTGGGAPSVAREVRRGVAEAYGPEWDPYVRLMTDLRVLAVERTGLSDAGLAPLFAAIDGAELRRLLAAGRTFTAKELFEEHASALGSPVDAAGGE
jgi:precorrin-2 dehydrogenase / sirohydrochlorin ferrochelatase